MSQEMDFLSQKVGYLLSANPGLTLKEIARSVGVDRHKIEWAVRQQYGFSFRELKKRTKLKRVTKLLLERQRSFCIKEIAFEVGLTPNALSRFIKSMTGKCATELQCPKR
jgi:AraC-like DNA-binding protein